MKRSCSVVLYLSLSFIFHVSANPAPYGKCTDIEGHHYQLPGKGHKTDYDGCIVTYEPNECKYLCYKPYVPRGEVVQWRNRPDGTWCPYTFNRGTSIHTEYVTVSATCNQGTCG
uniref:Putative salivary secreted protein n=1 Tax=Ornithodoros turicata TaxID=34597 RepID=A0A2R5L7S4_9ACAR